MSDCPKCGAASGHSGVVMPWSGGGPLEVLHFCPKDGMWLEGAKDHAYLMFKAKAWFSKQRRNLGRTFRRNEGNEDGTDVPGPFCGRIGHHASRDGRCTNCYNPSEPPEGV